jgi:3,4-dihydroxy 2-butanone 4-phosphate synthase/GTP cyclohydrolase II
LRELRLPQFFAVRDWSYKFWCNARMNDLAQRLATFGKSRLCVLCDDIGDDRSVLVAPAHEISEAEVNQILSFTGGLTFVALSPERASALMLSSMQRPQGANPAASTSATFAQYTSVEAREGVSTGISAADRATTIRILGASTPLPRALVKPGHIFPVETKPGSTLVRAAIPEAAIDIITKAGYSDAALFVDLLDRAGEIMPSAAAQQWAARHGLPLFSISEIIRERLVHEPLVERLSEATIPTRRAGEVKAVAYRSQIHDVEHVALVKGTLDVSAPVLVRVQVEQLIADVFGGNQPATRKQIDNSLEAIGRRGSGVFLYLRRKKLHDDPVLSSTTSQRPEAAHAGMMREYGVGAQILRDLGITQIELLSSTKRSLVGLESFGMVVSDQIPIPDFPSINKECTP